MYLSMYTYTYIYIYVYLFIVCTMPYAHPFGAYTPHPNQPTGPAFGPPGQPGRARPGRRGAGHLAGLRRRRCGPVYMRMYAYIYLYIFISCWPPAGRPSTTSARPPATTTRRTSGPRSTRWSGPSRPGPAGPARLVAYRWSGVGHEDGAGSREGGVTGAVTLRAEHALVTCRVARVTRRVTCRDS